MFLRLDDYHAMKHTIFVEPTKNKPKVHPSTPKWTTEMPKHKNNQPQVAQTQPRHHPGTARAQPDWAQTSPRHSPSTARVSPDIAQTQPDRAQAHPGTSRKQARTSPERPDCVRHTVAGGRPSGGLGSGGGSPVGRTERRRLPILAPATRTANFYIGELPINSHAYGGGLKCGGGKCDALIHSYVICLGVHGRVRARRALGAGGESELR